MSNYSFLKKYIFDINDDRWRTSRHAFFSFSPHEIKEAEERLKLEFPKQLKEFFIQIGYGFLCNDDAIMDDRLMDPLSIADFHQRKGIFSELNSDAPKYDPIERLAFLEVSEVSFITMDMTNIDNHGNCPIYYNDIQVAFSLSDFLQKIDAQTDYYLQLAKKNL